MNTELANKKDASEFLRISVSYIDKLTYKKEIPHSKED